MPSLGSVRPDGSAWAQIGSLALQLLLVLLACRFLVAERVMLEPLPPPPPQVQPVQWVIPPGREARARELLAPLDAGALPGVDQFSFSVEGRELAVQLFNAQTRGDAGCPGPSWVRTPGAFFLSRGPPTPESEDADTLDQATRIELGTLQLRYYWCEGEAPAAALTKLTQNLAVELERADLWEPFERPVVEPEPEPEPGPKLSGLLRPLVEVSGVDHHRLSMGLLLGLCVAALAVGLGFGPGLPGPLPEPDTRSAPRWLWLVVLLAFALAFGLRLFLLDGLAQDADEPWAMPFEHSLFHESHDAWVHPPLFHLLQQPWVQAIGWTPAHGLLSMRAPAIAAGALSLALLLVALTRRAARPALVLCALPCLFSPDFILAAGIARPYPFAGLFVVIVALSLWAKPDASGVEAPFVARLRWAALLLAAGLATWVDILAGAVAGMLVLARMIEVREQLLAQSGASAARSYLAFAAALAVIGLGALPFAPGVLEALEFHTSPDLAQETIDALGILRPGEVRPDPDLTRRVPGFCMLGLNREVLLWSVLGLAMALAIAVRGWGLPDRRVVGLLPLLLVLGFVLIASTTVHLRARNLVFAPQIIAWFSALILARERG